ncbi:MAG TPA: prepilin-type N-terminal cleavage/methylation domain-containing protein [Gemmatimonadales bacterium]|nr:prepilin-type N-terminal cleavage/methylation domain-containing protein [Gemmatimonadales bacterium]
MFRSNRASCAGFTLIELMIAISCVGILMLIGIPKSQAALRQTNLRSARNAVINLYQMGRTRAINENRSVTLNMDATSVWLTAQPRKVALAGSDRDTVGTVQNLNAQYGVTLVPDGATYRVDARGLGNNAGAPNKIVFTKSGARDSFTISGYGRIEK